MGSLEQQYQYGEHLVCAACVQVLQLSTDAAEAEDQIAFEGNTLPNLQASLSPRKRRKQKSSIAPAIVTVAVSAACMVIAWVVLSGHANDSKKAVAADTALNEYNRLIVSANQFASNGQDEAAVEVLQKALRLHEASPELSKAVERAPVDAQIKQLRSRIDGKRASNQAPPPQRLPNPEPEPSFLASGVVSVPSPVPSPEPMNRQGDTKLPEFENFNVSPPVPGPSDARVDVPQPPENVAFQLLRDGELETASKQFDQMLKDTPSDPLARVGKAATMLLTHNRTGAIAELEKICASGSSHGAAPVLLAQELLKDNPVRAVLILSGHLNAQSKHDERAVNLLGRALWTCREQGRESRVIDEGERLYLRLDQALSLARPGQKRWGKDWLPVSEADAKWLALRSARSELNASGSVVAQAQSRLDRLREQYAEARRSVRNENLSKFRLAMNEIESQLVEHRRRLDRARRAYEEVDKPNFGSDLSIAEIVAN
jgi:flagellar basal body-associated protein FliL